MSNAAYLLAQTATASLRNNSADPAAREQYATALRGLGLLAAAEAFLTGRQAVPGAANSGLIPWSSRRRRFAANVRAAAERWPGLAELAAFWDAHAGDYQLHQSTDGNYHIFKCANPEFHTAWMAGLLDHKGQAPGWSFDKAATPIPAPYAFDGAGHGWFLLHMAAATERSFLSYSAAIYLVEPDLIALGILFHLQDLQALLRGGRLRLFAGAKALEDFQAALRANATWSIPQQFVTARLTSPGVAGLQAAAEALIKERQAAEDAQFSQIQARLAARDIEYWRARFAGGMPVRVLAITTRYSTVLRWSMEELAAAIRAAGHEVEVVMEADDQSLENGLVERLDRFDPDLLVLISRLRHENPRLPRNIPFLCWDQDNLPCMRTPEATASLDRYTYVAGFGAIYGEFVLNWPAANCLPCFAAAAAHRYRPRALTAAETARFGADFSYVSNASGSPESLQASLARAFGANATALGLFEKLAAEIIARSRESERFDQDGLREFVTERAAALGLALPEETRTEFINALRALADRCFRHATLEWVAVYCRRHNRTLHLYGTGWESHPTLGVHARGRIDPGEELTAIYGASRISLQIIESGPIHSRFLDGMAAGGFFLLRETTRPAERAAADAQWALASRAAELGIATGQQMLSARDPEILRLWKAVGAPKAGCTPDQITTALRHWRELPPHYVDLPHMDAMTFYNEETFAARAERFLGDEALRRRIAAEVREGILERYSYDARWAQFLGLVRAGLNRQMMGA